MGSEDGGNTLQPKPDSPPATGYSIRVDGLLDAYWSEWLDGMTLHHEAGGVTRLEGFIQDQAALYGLINKLRDLGLTLLTVERLNEPPATPDA